MQVRFFCLKPIKCLVVPKKYKNKNKRKGCNYEESYNGYIKKIQMENIDTSNIISS